MGKGGGAGGVIRSIWNALAHIYRLEQGTGVLGGLSGEGMGLKKNALTLHLQQKIVSYIMIILACIIYLYSM